MSHPVLTGGLLLAAAAPGLCLYVQTPGDPDEPYVLLTTGALHLCNLSAAPIMPVHLTLAWDADRPHSVRHRLPHWELMEPGESRALLTPQGLPALTHLAAQRYGGVELRNVKLTFGAELVTSLGLTVLQCPLWLTRSSDQPFRVLPLTSS